MSVIKNHFHKNILPKVKATGCFSELARRTGLSISTVRHIAQGKNDNPTMRVIDCLNDELCDGSDFLKEGSVQPDLVEMSNKNKTEKVN